VVDLLDLTNKEIEHSLSREEGVHLSLAAGHGLDDFGGEISPGG